MVFVSQWCISFHLLSKQMIRVITSGNILATLDVK